MKSLSCGGTSFV